MIRTYYNMIHTEEAYISHNRTISHHRNPCLCKQSAHSWPPKAILSPHMPFLLSLIIIDIINYIKFHHFIFYQIETKQFKKKEGSRWQERNKQNERKNESWSVKDIAERGFTCFETGNALQTNKKKSIFFYFFFFFF